MTPILLWLIKLIKIRLVITLASINNRFLHQIDVNNAFLHGDLQEDLYMLIPLGVTPFMPNQVCKLIKSFYGLKQASRKRYEKFTSILVVGHFTQATSDHSLFIKSTPTCFILLLKYMLMILSFLATLSLNCHMSSMSSIFYMTFSKLKISYN